MKLRISSIAPAVKYPREELFKKMSSIHSEALLLFGVKRSEIGGSASSSFSRAYSGAIGTSFIFFPNFSANFLAFAEKSAERITTAVSSFRSA